MQKKLICIEANTTGTGMLALKKALDLGLEPVFFTNKTDRYLGLKDIGCAIVETQTNLTPNIEQAIRQNVAEKEIAGFFTTSEFYIGIVSQLASNYNLPGNSIEAMNICRNKAKTRLHLQAAKIKQPKFYVAKSINEVPEALKRLGLPCIIKPVDDSGSNNVRLCNSLDEVLEMATRILDTKCNIRGQESARIVLLEEYIDAPEFSVEMFTKGAKTKRIGITEKYLTGFPYFVERKHIFPAKLEPNIVEEIYNTVEKAIKSIGIVNGPTHTEVKLTAQGCMIIEINARLAGGMIPKLIELSTGIDMLEKQIRLCVGELEDFESIAKYYAGIEFIMANQVGIVEEIAVNEQLNVNEITINTKVGDKVYVPENSYHRLGHVIVKEDTYEQAKLSLQRATENIAIKIQCDRLHAKI